MALPVRIVPVLFLGGVSRQGSCPSLLPVTDCKNNKPVKKINLVNAIKPVKQNYMTELSEKKARTTCPRLSLEVILPLHIGDQPIIACNTAAPGLHMIAQILAPDLGRCWERWLHGPPNTKIVLTRQNSETMHTL